MARKAIKLAFSEGAVLLLRHNHNGNKFIEYLTAASTEEVDEFVY